MNIFSFNFFTNKIIYLKFHPNPRRKGKNGKNKWWIEPLKVKVIMNGVIVKKTLVEGEIQTYDRYFKPTS